MALIDSDAYAVRFAPSATVEESLERVTNLINGLAHGGELKAVYLFVTDGPDVRLAMVIDCKIMGLEQLQVVDGPVFTAANVTQISELVSALDEYQARLWVEGKLQTIGTGPDDGLKVLYCRKAAPRTDDKDELDAAKELIALSLNSSGPTPTGAEFLQLF